MEAIYTADAPAAIGPYSQGILYAGFFYSSGQIPLNPSTGKLVGEGIEEQAEQVMKNISFLLEQAGTSFKNVVKTTCFLTDINDFQIFNQVYSKYFISRPARSCVAVKTLPQNARCEVEVVAVVEK